MNPTELDPDFDAWLASGTDETLEEWRVRWQATAPTRPVEPARPVDRALFPYGADGLTRSLVTQVLAGVLEGVVDQPSLEQDFLTERLVFRGWYRERPVNAAIDAYAIRTLENVVEWGRSIGRQLTSDWRRFGDPPPNTGKR